MAAAASAAAGLAVASPLSNGNSVSFASSQSQLFGLGRISRGGQSLRSSASSRAAIRASSDSGEASRKDAVRSSNGGLERRQLLVASTAAAAGLVLPAGAAPIGAPDLTKCIPSTDDRLKASGVASVQCCPPLPGAQIKDFKFPAPLPLKVRKPTHLLTDKEKATYEKAYAAIAALPASDPRSFTAQANVHCSYCNYGFFQQDGVTPLQVHESWLFFPFHRWYLYFHERILAKFANDPTFALPYWNWDNQANTTPLPNTHPAVFLDPVKYPTLSRGKRDPLHYPNILLDFQRRDPKTVQPDQVREENTARLYNNIVAAATTPSLFFGGRYVAGDAKTPGGGTIESLPHGPPHAWVGTPGGTGEDMGNFFSAGRDPIFYSHHSNVDRVWTVWKTLPGNSRKDFDDPDYLNATFLFYDENAELVRVRVGDSLDTARLGYNFAPSPDLWRFYQPKVATASAATSILVPGGGLFGGSAALAAEDDGPGPRGRGEGRRGGGPALGDGPDGGPRRRPRRREDLTDFGGKSRTIDNEEGFAFKLSRPDRPQRRGRRGPPGSRNRSLTPPPQADDDDEDEEEILVIKGVKVSINERISFDVFLNLPEADKTTSITLANYVGTYFNVPHTGPRGNAELTTNFRLGLGDTLRQLGITDTSELVVTLVPTDGETPIIVSDVSIEYE